MVKTMDIIVKKGAKYLPSDIKYNLDIINSIVIKDKSNKNDIKYENPKIYTQNDDPKKNCTL